MPTQTKSRKGIGGPKTPEGKERVRLNALKLGLYAQSLEGMQAVADVVGVAFHEVHQRMLDYYRPIDPLEEALVRRIARCTWKLMLVECMEDHLLKGLPVRDAPGRSLEGISVIERRTDVQLHRAIAALAGKRRHDKENEKNKLADQPLVDAFVAEPESVSPPDSSSKLPRKPDVPPPDAAKRRDLPPASPAPPAAKRGFLARQAEAWLRRCGIRWLEQLIMPACRLHMKPMYS